MRHIRESNERMKSLHLMWEGRIDVYNKRELPEEINIEDILSNLSSKIPSVFLNAIDSVYVGEFDSLRKREVDSVYQDGAIYIVPSYITGQEDLARNIIHEIGHAVEEKYSLDIYGDGNIKDEFMKKRIKLLDNLKRLGYDIPSIELYMNPDYSKELDDYFYKEIGYPTLATLGSGVFVSPYGITSLREYFANVFEEFFLDGEIYAKKISPEAYNKIQNLIKEKEEAYGDF